MKKALFFLFIIVFSSLSAKNLLVDSTKFTHYLEIKVLNMSDPGLVEVSPGITLNGRLSIEYHFNAYFMRLWNSNYSSYSSHGIGTDILLIKNKRFNLSVNLRTDFGLHRWEHSSYDNIFYSNISEGGFNIYWAMIKDKKLKLTPGIGIHYGYTSEQIPPDINLYGSPNYSFWFIPADLYLQIEKFYLHAHIKTWFDNNFQLIYGAINLGVGFIIIN